MHVYLQRIISIIKHILICYSMKTKKTDTVFTAVELNFHTFSKSDSHTFKSAHIFTCLTKYCKELC